MIADAYKLAEKLVNECEPYVPLDEIIFIEAANLLVKLADQNQLLKSQLIFEKLKNKLTNKDDKFH